MAAQGMQQRQSLALQQVLSPQLQQSLLILQTPLLELRNLVQQEMETNPVLEELPEESGANERSEAEAAADENFRNEFEKLASLDEEWRDYMAQSAGSNFDGRRGSKDADEKRQFLFDSIPVQETLQQNLIAQLNQTVLSADDRKASELIIGNIDDDGFLQSTTEEMALNSGIPQDDFERVLGLIQTFHPAGVGARDLRDCLLMQLRRQGKEHSLEHRIVSEHMDDLGRHRFGDRAPNGDQRRGCAKGCRQYRAIESSSRPDLRCRAAELRVAGHDPGKGRWRISDLLQQRTNSASADQQSLQGHFCVW